MKRTDVSGNEVKIDFQALLETAKIAVALARREMERNLNEIQHNQLYKSGGEHAAVTNGLAESMVESAQKFQTALEVMNALEYKTRGRDKLTIYNY